MTADADAGQAVEAAARAARDTVADLASVPDELLDDALRTMADQLVRRADPVLEANEADIRAAQADGIRDALLDRLRLDQTRIEAIAGQLRALARVRADPGPRARGGGRAGRAGPADDQGAAGRAAADRTAAAGRRDRRQLRGPAQRRGGHRVAVRQVPQRRSAADGFSGDPFGDRAGG